MRVASPPVKRLLIFDGDCNFCRRWVARWEQSTGNTVDYLPAQNPQIAARFPEIPVESYTASIQLIEPDGTVYQGAQAALRALNRTWLYEQVPGFAPLSEWIYRLVARHRTFFSQLTRLLLGNDVTRPSYSRSREIFIRSLGVIYLIAFISLWTQIDGLIGSHGIMPAKEFMESAQGSLGHNGAAAYWMLPTVFWFGVSDTALHVVCGLGSALAVCVIVGIGVGPALLILWGLYLSLLQVSGVFLGYQWDALLLETGFLAVWFAPWGLLPGTFRHSQPSRLVLFFMRWLLFRLVFCSGVVKLASGDLLWHSLTALTVHYQTQPLPTWPAWYAHQLPVSIQKFSCAVMFVIELIFPFFIFGPRRLRALAAAGIVFLMTLISITGNYCFFNLLTIALCVLLLDDAAYELFARKLRLTWLLKRQPATGDNWSSSRWRNWLFAPVAIMILLITIPTLPRATQSHVRWSNRFIALTYNANFWCWPLHSINSYGLFAVMTPTRPELILEGSDDGNNWRAYEFKYKPGDLSRRPAFVWPHQPRLDWQMWFEALHVLQPHYQPSEWYLRFCVCLLQGRPEVLRLLAYNPFPDKPPRYLRTQVYNYQFTDADTRRATSQWWQREFKGDYCPVLSLRQ